MLLVSSVRQLLHIKKFEKFSTRHQTFIYQIEITLFPGFITALSSQHLLFVQTFLNFDKVGACFAVHLGSRAIYFRVLLCGRLSYCSKTTSFWRRLGRWRLIAPYNCHKDQRVAPSFSCNEIRKHSTLTASLKAFEMEYEIYNTIIQSNASTHTVRI